MFAHHLPIQSNIGSQGKSDKGQASGSVEAATVGNYLYKCGGVICCWYCLLACLELLHTQEAENNSLLMGRRSVDSTMFTWQTQDSLSNSTAEYPPAMEADTATLAPASTKLAS